MRPRLLVVVTGTGTEVGKTWVGAEVLRGLRRAGRTVAARKPVQSHAPGDTVTDADRLASASGERPETVCPPDRRYPLALAPPMAAARLGRPVPTRAVLAAEVSAGWPDPPVDVGLIEGAGGAASPLAADGDTSDVARAVGADVAVLVADSGLGTIHAVRLATRALAPLPVVVHLNRFDPENELHRLNREWLAGPDGMTLTTGIDALVDRLLAGGS